MEICTSILVGSTVLLSGLSYILFKKLKYEYNLKNVTSEMSNEIVLLEDREKVAVKMKSLLIKYLDIVNASIILYDEELSDYVFLNPEDLSKEIGSFKEFNNFFIMFESHDQIMSIKDVERVVNDSGTLASAKKYFSTLESEICVPLIFESRLIGLINIEKKKSGQKFTKFDYEIINYLRRYFSIAFTNSLLFKSMSKMFEDGQGENDDLHEQDNAKSEMMVNIGHEIKIPISSAENNLHYLISGKFGDLKKKQSDIVDLTLKELDKIDKLVGSVQLFSKVSTSKMELNIESVNLLSLISECLDQEQKYAKENDIKLLFDSKEDLIVKGDWDKLKIVIINLLNNAIKYTKKGSVTIILEKKQNHVNVMIEDTGIGIPDERIPTIFERYLYDSHRFGKKYSGIGIGLFLVKSILELHNTTIYVKSKINQGTVFSFRLPIDKEEQKKILSY